MANKIFIGSSSEAAKRVVPLLKAEIESLLGPGSVLQWDDGAFSKTKITLETIEDLHNKAVGGVLVMTPDVECDRNGKGTREPISNVIFEYGYLSARLMRDRVAICRFGDAALPSDLEGLTTIDAGPYEKDAPPPLDPRTKKDLQLWLRGLPAMAEEVPPVSSIHGYSGMWHVRTVFKRWRGIDLGPNDEVFFNGLTFLFLSVDGKGTGIQVGETTVKIGEYKTTFSVRNSVKPTVDGRGTLRLAIQVFSSVRGKETGKALDSRVNEDLAGDRAFEVTLKPKKGAPSTLTGDHHYSPASSKFQKAGETYKHIGLSFDPGPFLTQAFAAAAK